MVSVYGNMQILILLSFLISISSSNDTTTESSTQILSPYHNTVEARTFCKTHIMRIQFNFSRPFAGLIFPKNFFHVPLCSLYIQPWAPVTTAVLEIPYYFCGSGLKSTNSGVGTRIWNRINIRTHHMITSEFDIQLNVSCKTDRPKSFVQRPYFVQIIPTYRALNTELAFLPGFDLPNRFKDPSNIDSSSLYFLIIVKGVSNKDLVVRNCIAHSTEHIGHDTQLTQISDFFGCEESEYLHLFDVRIANKDKPEMIAFSRIKDAFNVTTLSDAHFTCGINICNGLCERNCEKDKSQRLGTFTHIVTWGQASKRAKDAVIPTELAYINKNG